MRKAGKIIVAALMLPVFAILCTYGTLYFLQDWVIFRSKPLPDTYLFTHFLNAQECFLDAEDGGVIHALHFKTPNPQGVVLYFHGRGGNLAHPWQWVAKDFIGRGYDLFLMDYRGFGKSRGKRTQKALLADAERCYQFLADEYDPQTITLYGRSLGTGFATFVASQYPAKQLILESPYSSLKSLAKRTCRPLPHFLVSWALKYPMESDVWMTKVRCPVYIFHTKEDRVIPYKEGWHLAHCISQATGSLMQLRQGEHDSIVHHPMVQQLLDALLSPFVDECGDQSSPTRLVASS